MSAENLAEALPHFDDMTALQRRLHNAAIVLGADGDEYGFENLLREAIAALDAHSAEQEQAGEAVGGSFMTREQAIEHCRKRRPGIEPTEQHIAATIDAYSALFGDLVPAPTEAGVNGHVAWVVRVPGGYKDVGYESRVINKLAHGTLLYTRPQQPLTRELKELEADLNELSDGAYLCPGWDVRRLRTALGITKDTK